MFELYKNHKSHTNSNWKRKGIKFTEEEFEYIYSEYIIATNCDLCNKEFKSTLDRHLDHNHENGEARNIVCRSCNQRREDNKMLITNTSGYKHISKYKKKDCKQGFTWVFRLQGDGKMKQIKSSIDLDKLIIFRDNWIKENNYIC